jgi:hypothetical protein
MGLVLPGRWVSCHRRTRVRAVRLPGRPRSLTGAQVVEAVRLRGEGESFRDIAARLGVGRESVRRATQRVQGVPEPDPAPDVPPAVAPTVVTSETQPAADRGAEDRPSWPPVPDQSTLWVRVPLGLAGGAPTTRVRQIRLGQRSLYADEQNRIWCDCHFRLHTVGEAMRLDRSCRASLSRVALGTVRPIGAHEVEPRDQPAMPVSGAW